jgi:thiosulfate dehydrogenase
MQNHANIKRVWYLTSQLPGKMKKTLLFSICSLSLWACNDDSASRYNPAAGKKDELLWLAPSLSSLPDNDSGKLIRYGHELIANTSQYFGPKGSLAHITNGMNCQNCHMKAGTQPWANNFAAVATSYPKFRARSGSMENITKRINECFLRSMNGAPPDSNSREMAAMKAYVTWLGSNVPAGKKPLGTGTKKLALLDRAGDTAEGKKIFLLKCQSCHTATGKGLMADNNASYIYPPLWGEKSYNVGAGLNKISELAAFVRSNMPQGTDYANPQLTEAEAWDVAAYIVSQPRAAYDLKKDWPDISAKPMDYAFGPFSDTFPVTQHKYGPFAAIVAFKEKNKKK